MEIDRRSFVQSILVASAVGSVQAEKGEQPAPNPVIGQLAQVAPDLQVTPPLTGTRFDIIIVGGGTIGLSAAYYAAARGLKTLLLEQYDQFADARASSGGHSRFFRIMHSSAYMAQLAESALALWQEIETASGRKILKQQRLIFYGVSGQTPEGNLGEMERVLAQLGLPYQRCDSGAALKNSFPAFKDVPEEYIALVQPNSAVIRTRESIAAFHQLATSEGATLLKNQRAAVATRKGMYQVTCPAGTYIAPHLILAPSAWTNHLLKSFGIQLNLTIWQMTVAYFQAEVNNFDYPLWYEFGPPKQREASMLPRMHMTQCNDEIIQDLFYGFPPDENPGYIKASADFAYCYNKYTDPDQCTYRPDPEILKQLGRFLQGRFNGVSPTPTEPPSTCLYTFSADGQMVLDALPGHPNVAIFTLDSGRGFKFTPLVGRVLVDLATRSSTGYDISPLSINRPGIIVKQ